MADKEKLTKSFGSNRRRNKPSLEEIEKIAREVPASSAGAAKPKKGVKKPAKAKPKKVVKQATTPVVLKKTSVDLPLELYQDVKIHLIKRQMKFREYLIKLIEADLKKRK